MAIITRFRTALTHRHASVAVLALAVVPWIFPVPGLQAQQLTPKQQECVDSWDDAPAEPHCPIVGVNYDKGEGHCYVFGTCSISTTVGTGEDAETQTWNLDFGNITGSPEEIEQIDLCFAADTATGEYVVTVKAGCGSDIDSSTALEGLEALPAE